MNVYQAFGFVIESELEFPEFDAGSGNPELTIEYGVVPASIKNAKVRSVTYEANASEFIFNMKNVAHYHVTNGCKIVVQPYPNADVSSIRKFLLGPVMAALGSQKGFFPMIGSCNCINGKATILIGLTGVGRSTLAAHLWRAGFPFQADGVILISLNKSETPSVRPSFPYLDLFPDMLESLGIDQEEAMPIRSGHVKRKLHLQDTVSTDEVPLQNIVQIARHRQPESSYLPITGRHKFGIVMEYGINAYYLRHAFGEMECLDRILKLTQGVKMHRLKYSKDNPVRELVDHLVSSQ